MARIETVRRIVRYRGIRACDRERLYETANAAITLTKKMAISAGVIGIDTVKVVVDGNVPNIMLWESVVDVQACQRGIMSKS